MEYIKFIGLLCLTWGIVKGFGSVQWLKNQLTIGETSKPTNLIPIVFQGLFNCAICTGFWVGVIAYYPYENYLLWACIVSVSAELFTRLLSYLLSR